jgi:hypothetical protein
VSRCTCMPENLGNTVQHKPGCPAAIPMPREALALPIRGLRGDGLCEAVARSLLELGDPDEWGLLPCLGLLYRRGDRVGIAVELAVPVHLWLEMERPIHVLRWLADTIRSDLRHPDFNADHDLVAVWLVAEAWLSRRPIDMEDEDAPMPSQDPDRIKQRLCLVVGADSVGYTSLDRGSTKVVMHHEADGRLVDALRDLLEVML